MSPLPALPALTPLDAVADSAPPAAPHPRQPWHWVLWQLLLTYLPLVLMTLLALGTWWLIGQTSLPSDAPQNTVLRHEPDYEMRNFAVQRFAPEGSLRALIEGDVVRHYPDTDTLEIDNVRVRAVAPDGRVTLATAQRAITNSEATEVQLLGQAEVVRQASAGQEDLHFQSEFLHAFLNDERVVSNRPVTITQGETLVRAERMEYTHAQGVIRFSGRTRASFAPRSGP